MRSSKIYVPQNVGELRDLLSLILLSAPKCLDNTGYFPYQNLDYVFQQLLAGLDHNRATLGDERHHQLMEMSGRIRALFEADPDDKTGETLQGCKIINEMADILDEVRRKSARR